MRKVGQAPGSIVVAPAIALDEPLVNGATTDRFDRAGAPPLLGNGLPERNPAKLAASLKAAGFRGELASDPKTREAYSRDFGKLAQALPMLVAKPVGAADVQLLVTAAARHRLVIANRSGGHAVEGQGLVHDGIVLSTESLRLGNGERMAIEQDAGRTVVRVTPSVRVGELGKFLASQGLRLRSATMDGYPGIGGAVSVAGIGLGSHRHGSMADQIMELVGVNGRGETIRVKSQRHDYSDFAGEHAELADLMVGGMGQAGVITELTFPVVPLKGEARVFKEVLPSPQALLARVEQLTKEADDDTIAVYGVAIKKLGVVLNVAVRVRDVTDGSGEKPDPFQDPAHAPDVYPAWMDVINPSFTHAAKLLESHPELIADLAHTLGIALLIPQKKIRADRTTINSWTKAAVGDSMLAFGIFYYLDKAGAAALVDKLRVTRDHVTAELGAQPYFMDGVPKGPSAEAEWRKHLGDARFERIRDLLDRADPHGVFKRLPGFSAKRLTPFTAR